MSPAAACARDDVPSAEVRRPFAHQGHAYVAPLPGSAADGDTAALPRASRLIVCEGDRALGPAHSVHDDIRNLGAGRFSHWHDALYFSSSDNTDPGANGRVYRVVAVSPCCGIAYGEGAERGGSGDGMPGGRDWQHAKHGEHAAALALVPDAASTHVAVRSGAWSELRTWRNGALPVAGARVVIADDVEVAVDGTYDGIELDWVRVDGTLRLEPQRDTALVTRTMVVSPRGHLEVGTDETPVRQGVSARLLFAPRPARDRRADPFDLAGGLISLGTVTMVAEARTSHVPVRAAVIRGTRRLAFAEPPRGWRVGDQLLVPGTVVIEDQDEVPMIASIGDGGRVVELDHPLAFDHPTPRDVALWIGNLTRNIVVASRVTEPLAARGHLMIMHAQTGTVFDGVAFRDLGRTDTRVGHTVPVPGPDGTTRPGSDDNTIGRYAVHFHVREGALRSVAPHVVRNCVVLNSPKYGIVNHGGHVIAEQNITFRVAGSHLVAENGSEIGAFRGNMAVRSSGSGDPTILSRMGIYDNAHGGNGIWLVSGGVEVTGNWASGHADSGLKMLAMQFFEQKREIFFDARNIASTKPAYADALGRVALADVNLTVRGNFFAASGNGIELWNHKEFATHRERSVIEGNTVWNVKERAIFLPYTRNTTLSGNHLVGPEGARSCEFCFRVRLALMHRWPSAEAEHDRRCTHAAIEGNRATANIEILGGSVAHFAVGIRLPQQGNNVVRRVVLDNAVDMEIPGPSVPGRHIELDNVAFASDWEPAHLSIYMQDVADPFSGDVAILFGEDRIEMTANGERRRLFSPAQARDARAFRAFGPMELRSMTNAEIEQRFGLALGGALAPAESSALAQSNALSMPASPDAPADRAWASYDDPNYWRYWLYDPHAATLAEYATPGKNGGPPAWTQLRAKLAALRREGHLAEEVTPSIFMLHPSLEPLQIHPDDVQYGYRILGYVVDKVDGRLRAVAHFEEFHGLRVDEDGMVRVRAQTPVRTGARTEPVELVIRVTPSAKRRGPNLDWFLQSAYCGGCGGDITRRANELLASVTSDSSPSSGGARGDNPRSR